jgi:GntR family transcriptional regulator / MocR family aminotransferase
VFELEMQPVVKGSRTAAHSIHRQLKAAILDGRLKSGTQLPPSRASRSLFGVSRNTVNEVYARLITEGLAVGRHGSGTYVSARAGRAAPPRSARGERVPPHRLNPFWLQPEVTAALNFWREPVERNVRKQTRADFRPAMIDSRLFPFDALRLVMAKQLRESEKKPAGRKSAQGNQGNFRLREAITTHIALTRSVVCGPDDIIVTSGAQQAFDVLARVLVRPNDTIVAMEDPGYPPMRMAFAAAGATLVPVRVDSEGLVVDELPEGVGVICVCPSHQFPLGLTMSKRRRRALLEYARRRGAVVIEDDYDGEFRFDGQPLESLRARHSDVVFYVGTFSKCMLPSLRLGFVVAPKWAMPALITAKNCLDWHSPTLLQGAVARFIADGHLRKHVRRMRNTYAERRELLRAGLLGGLSTWLRPIPSYYGMHVAAAAAPTLDLESIARRAQEKGVMIHTLSRYYAGPETQAGFVFGYGVTEPADIRYGLSVLASLLARQS